MVLDHLCLQYSHSPSWNGLVQVLNSLAEFYTILREEHLQIALEMVEAGICSSLWSPEWFSDVQIW
jgi:hypothetical protein